MRNIIRLALVVAALVAVERAPGRVHASQRAADVLPPSTVLYAEIGDPPGALNLILSHPFLRGLRTVPAYQQMLHEKDAQKFLTAVRYVESQLEMSWREAFETATQGGVALAFDARTKGTALLLRGADEKRVARITETFVRLIREDAERKGERDPFEQQEYRGILVYRLKHGGFATLNGWFVLVSKVELGQEILDALLHTREHALANIESFQQAERELNANRLAWLFAQIDKIRESGAVPGLFSGKTDDPLTELLFGGVMDVLQRSDRLSVAVEGNAQHLSLTLSMPFDRSWISGQRQHYFGADGTGRAPQYYDVPQTLFAVAAYRDLSTLWRHAGDLFDDHLNDEFADADKKLSTFFSGKNFGQEILGSIAPRLLIIATRQSFAHERAVPAIRLPAIALVTELSDPETASRDLRRLFESLIGFLNVVGAIEGGPQLELAHEPLSAGELMTATFVPSQDNPGASLHQNFSPTIAFCDSRMIVSSTDSLARTLSQITPAEPTYGSDVVNVAVVIAIDVLQDLLRDNLAPLVSHTMEENELSEGDARTEVEAVLDLLGLFQQVGLQLSTNDHALSLTVDLRCTALQASE